MLKITEGMTLPPKSATGHNYSLHKVISQSEILSYAREHTNLLLSPLLKAYY